MGEWQVDVDGYCSSSSAQSRDQVSSMNSRRASRDVSVEMQNALVCAERPATIESESDEWGRGRPVDRSARGLKSAEGNCRFSRIVLSTRPGWRTCSLAFAVGESRRER